MTITYQISNSANWNQIWSTTRTAQSVEPSVLEKYYPIPEIVAPFQFDNPILAVYADSNSAEEHWKLAGKAQQKVLTGLVVGGTPETVTAIKRIWLKQISLLIFPRLASTYTLGFNIPYWLRDINLIVWEYVGPINDSIDQKLTAIQSDLATLQNDFHAFTGL